MLSRMPYIAGHISVAVAFESTSLSAAAPKRLKRDLDGGEDSYGSIWLSRYPGDGALAIVTLREKKLPRLIVRA